MVGTGTHALFCPMCGDADFYTSAPIPSGAFSWVVDLDGRVCVSQTADDITVTTVVPDEVYCTGCHALVTGTAVARAHVKHG